MISKKEKEQMLADLAQHQELLHKLSVFFQGVGLIVAGQPVTCFNVMTSLSEYAALMLPKDDEEARKELMGVFIAHFRECAEREE